MFPTSTCDTRHRFQSLFIATLAIWLFTLSTSASTEPASFDKDENRPSITVSKPKDKAEVISRADIAIESEVALPAGDPGFESITIMIVKGKSGASRQKIYGSFAYAPKTDMRSYKFYASLKAPKVPGTYYIFARGVVDQKGAQSSPRYVDSEPVEINVKQSAGRGAP